MCAPSFLSISLVISKTQVLFHWVFVVFVSLLLISAQGLVISSHLLVSGMTSCFLRTFRYVAVLLIKALSGYLFVFCLFCRHLSLWTALIVSHSLGVCCIFIFINSIKFSFLPWFLSQPVFPSVLSCSVSVSLFTFHCFCDLLISGFNRCWWDRSQNVISLFLYLLRLY